MKSERWWTTARAIAYFDLADADAAGLEPERMVETARRIGADAVGLQTVLFDVAAPRQSFGRALSAMGLKYPAPS